MINIPKPSTNIQTKKTLPFNGKAVSEKSFSFSFSCFDRTHELFNLGNNAEDTISGGWFLDLLDCLKSVSNMSIDEIRKSTHDLHPIDWRNTNTKKPLDDNQYDYYQFRINKSKGRVIGFVIDGVFYIVWLDPYHNLTNSVGYGNENYYKPGISLYEKKENEIVLLNEEINRLKDELSTAIELLNC